MTKDGLLDSMRRERTRLDGAIASLDDDRRTAPVLDGGRSVKDVLAHITAWEQRCLSKMRDDAQGVAKPAGDGFEEDAMNRFNDAVFEANRERSWDDVAAESALSHAEMLAAVEVLDEAQLQRTVRWDEEAGQPLWQFISWDSDEHYRGHADQIAESTQRAQS